jgi:hypothetical protein
MRVWLKQLNGIGSIKMGKKYDLSIVIPAIRTNAWPILYKSVENACKKYKWQLVLISPFALPDELKDKDNILLIKEYGNVPRCVQRGVEKAESPLFFLTVDDCIFAKDSIDLAMDKYKEVCSENDVIAMIYGEGGNKMDKEYWTVKGPPGRPDIAAPLQLPGINREWRIANQCLMSRQYFIDLGGLDCENFSYLDKPIHDFMFRLQRNGGKIYFSPKHVCIATHFPLETGDHGPIHNTGSKDSSYFNMIYSIENFYANRIKLEYDNWKKSPVVWKARFTKSVPKTYEDMCIMEGYDLGPINEMKKKLEGYLKCELM